MSDNQSQNSEWRHEYSDGIGHTDKVDDRIKLNNLYQASIMLGRIPREGDEELYGVVPPVNVADVVDQDAVEKVRAAQLEQEEMSCFIQRINDTNATLFPNGQLPDGSADDHQEIRSLSIAQVNDRLRNAEMNAQGSSSESESGSVYIAPNQRTTLVTQQVYCKVLFEAVHNWPGCPFEEVAYLRLPHRHVFHIKAVKSVTHSDRDVEFIMLKHGIEKYLHETYPNKQFGAKSCEMLANELIDVFDLDSADVSEDNENGAIVTVVSRSGCTPRPLSARSA